MFPARVKGVRVKTEKALVLIRLAVGAVFFSEGIQKFLFPETCGVERFVHIGIPWPSVMAPFVGVVEILFGGFILAGFLTRLAAIPLLIDISVAIATTKIPILLKQGFWAAAHEARTDYAMFLGLLFLAIVGGGRYSLETLFKPSPRWKKILLAVIKKIGL
jgi:putative oxidoreductase